MKKGFKSQLAAGAFLLSMLQAGILLDQDQRLLQSCQQSDIKTAFLKVLSPQAVTFSPNPIMAVDWYRIMPDSDTQLTWTPKTERMAPDGDLGLTHGNWSTFRVTGQSDTIIYSGLYCTVWEKQNTEWKIMVDASTAAVHAAFGAEAFSGLIPLDSQPIPTQTTLSEIDSLFTGRLPADAFGTYASVISENFIGIWPDTHADSILSQSEFFRDRMTSSWEWHRLITRTDSENRFGVVVGTGEETGTDETEPRKMSFLRVWVMESSEWELYLDMIIPIH